MSKWKNPFAENTDTLEKEEPKSNGWVNPFAKTDFEEKPVQEQNLVVKDEKELKFYQDVDKTFKQLEPIFKVKNYVDKVEQQNAIKQQPKSSEVGIEPDDPTLDDWNLTDNERRKKGLKQATDNINKQFVARQMGKNMQVLEDLFKIQDQVRAIEKEAGIQKLEKESGSPRELFADKSLARDPGSISHVKEDDVIKSTLNNSRAGRLVASVPTGVSGLLSGTSGFFEYLSGEVGAEGAEKFFGDAANMWDRVTQTFAPDDPNFVEQLVSGYASFGAFYGAGRAVGGVVGALSKAAPRTAKFVGLGAMAGLESLTESGSTYREARQKGKSKQEAQDAALKSLVANAVVITATDFLGYGGNAAGLKKAILSAPNEAIQEASQELISAWAQGEKVDWGEVFNSGAIGGIIGAGAGYAGVAETPSTQKDIVEKKFNKKAETKDISIPSDITSSSDVELGKKAEVSRSEKQLNKMRTEYEQRLAAKRKEEFQKKEDLATTAEQRKFSSTNKIIENKFNNLKKKLGKAEPEENLLRFMDLADQATDKQLVEKIAKYADEYYKKATERKKKRLTEERYAKEKLKRENPEKYAELYGKNLIPDAEQQTKISLEDIEAAKKNEEELGIKYAKHPDGSYKTKPEYTSDEWKEYTDSVLDAKSKEKRKSPQEELDNLTFTKPLLIPGTEGFKKATETSDLPSVEELKEEQQKPEVKPIFDKLGVNFKGEQNKGQSYSFDIPEYGAHTILSKDFSEDKLKAKIEKIKKEKDEYEKQKLEEAKKPEITEEPTKTEQPGEKEFTPKDDWENNLIKAREVAVNRLGVPEVERLRENGTLDWTNKESIVAAVKEYEKNQKLSHDEIVKKNEKALEKAEELYKDLDAASKKYVDKITSFGMNKAQAIDQLNQLKKDIDEKNLEKLSPATNEGILHIGNKTSKRFFSDYTNQPLPESNKGTIDFLNRWAKSEQPFKSIADVLHKEVIYTDPKTGKEIKGRISGQSAFSDQIYFTPDNPADIENYNPSFDKISPKLKDLKPITETKSEQRKKKIKKIEDEELNNALDDFLKKNNKLTSGIDPEALAAGLKLMQVYTKLEVYKFGDIVADVYAKIGDKIKDHIEALKKAYLSYQSDAPDNILDQMDSVKDIRNFDIVKFMGDKYFPTKEETIQNLVKGKDDPQTKLINSVYEVIKTGNAFNNPKLNELAEKAYNGTKASGAFTTQQTYNALEAAVNKYLSEISSELLSKDSLEAIKQIREIMRRLPTQSDRTKEKDELQQFSTPPTLVFVATKLLNANNNDSVLEPSAGTGNLLTLLKNNVKNIHANEIDKERAELLKNQGYDVTSENAEHINAILPKDVKPTRIIMNPPFSATGGRVKTNKTKYGYQHILSALDRLEPGGRLVAVVGEGSAFGRPVAMKDFWNRVIDKHRYVLRADIGIQGNEYMKYGTSFGNRIFVIDRPAAAKILKAGGIIPKLNDKPELKGDFTIEELLKNEKFNEIVEATEETMGTTSDDVQSRPGVPESEDNTRGDNVRTDTGTGRSGTASERIGESQSNDDITETPTREDTGARESEVKTSESAKVEPGEPGESLQPSSEDVSGTSELDYEATEDYSDRETEQSGLVVYKPRTRLAGAVAHPTRLVETPSMAAIDQPAIKYSPSIRKEVIEDGDLSDAQLETIALAGQRHEKIMSNGKRAGYFVGDGTGVGKGRIIAGIIADNFNKGRKKAIWVSVSTDLIQDARRDFDGIGEKKINTTIVNDFKIADAIPKSFNGVIFSTYTSLQIEKKNDSRARQLADWLGDDGVIVFDEAHKAKNVIGVGGGKPTKTGEVVVGLQEDLLPKARVVYASATGATDVRHMAYMTRLGLWGTGTAFENFNNFMNQIEGGGLGAMEMVSRDMKALGMYISRSISYDGVEYEEIEHAITEKQEKMYNVAAEAWRTISKYFDEALKETGGNTWAKSQVRRRFWNDHQRYFKQFITGLKLPTLIKKIDEYLKTDHSVVISLIQTQEAASKRAIENHLASGGDLDDLDLSPREILGNMIESIFPTQQYEEYTDDNGKLSSRPVVDSLGNPVENPEAKRMKEELLNKLSDISMPDNPLDQIINYFELEAAKRGDKSLRVAELTGRKKRVIKEVKKIDGEYRFTGKQEYKKRVPDDVASKNANIHEMQEFQNGKKRIAIISQAASTGISLHSDKGVKNKQRRVQVALELAWSADTQMQTFGRTHRSNQEVSPLFVLMSTNIGGEKRFSSTIAKRLASLSAISKGERKSSGQGNQLAKYDFENKYGTHAITELYDKAEYGNVEGMDDAWEALKEMGILRLNETSGKWEVPESYQGNVKSFLNRILALNIDKQNQFFDAFTKEFETQIERAKAKGDYDEGVADFKAESIKISKQPQKVYEDELSGSGTYHYELEYVEKLKPLSFEKALKIQKISHTRKFITNKASGNISLIENVKETTDPQYGYQVKEYRLRYVNGTTKVIKDDEIDRYEEIPNNEAKPLWEEKYKEVPKTKAHDLHLIVGTITPIWDKLKSNSNEKLKVIRLITDAGKRIVGVRIPNEEVGNILKQLNIIRKITDPNKIYEAVLEQGSTIELDKGFKLKLVKWSGDDAIELINDEGISTDLFDSLRDMGLLNERISFKQRFFVPTKEDAAIPVLQKIVEKYPPISDYEDNNTNTETDRDQGHDSSNDDYDDGNASDITFGADFGLTEMSRAFKKIASNPKVMESIGVSKENVKKFGIWSKQYFDQATEPPIYYADKNVDFRKIYDITEKYHIRQFAKDYNEILEDEQYLDKFEKFRSLSEEDQTELLDKIRIYHEEVLYDPLDLAKPEELYLPEFIEEYEINTAQADALYQIKKGYDAATELVKDGEKEFIRDHVPSILGNRTAEGSKYITLKEIHKNFKDHMKALEEVGVDITDEGAIDGYWSASPTFREDVAEYIVEKKYRHFGETFYLNLSRPLKSTHTIVASKREIDKDVFEYRYSYFDTMAEANIYQKNTEDGGWETTAKGRVKHMIANQEFQKQVGTFELLRLIEDANITMPDEVVKKLFDTLKAKGWTKHTIQRRFIPGLKWTAEELETNVKNYVHESSSAKNKFLGIIKSDEAFEKWHNTVKKTISAPNISDSKKSKAMADIRYAQKYLAGIRSADKSIMDTLRGMTAFWRLGGAKLSFLFQQTLQNIQMAYPLLVSKVGTVKASKIFVDSFTDTAKLVLMLAGEKLGKKVNVDISPELRELFKNLRYSKKVSAIGTQEFFGESVDPHVFYSGPVSKAWGKLVFVGRALSSGIELLTRIHSLVMFSQVHIGDGLTGDKLEKEVSDDIDRSMGEYGKGGRVPIMNPSEKEHINHNQIRRGLAKMYLVFKTFATHNMGLWRMMARNKNYGGLFIKGMVGLGLHGVRKFPMMATLWWIIGLFLDDGEDELEYEAQKAENYINDKLGGKIGSLLNRGFGTYAEVDISDLLNETAPIPSEGFKYSKVYGNDLQAVSAMVIESLSGAPYGTVSDLTKALKYGARLLEDAISKETKLTEKERKIALNNLRKLTPDFAKNVFTGLSYKEDGVEFRGKELISRKDLTSYDILLKVLSFNPEKISKAYESAPFTKEAKISRLQREVSRLHKIFQESRKPIDKRNWLNKKRELNKLKPSKKYKVIK